MLVEPPVAWMPHIVCAYAGAAGACSTRTLDQSASSSSAISIGSEVQMPWPISECASSTVTVSSVPMRRNALAGGSFAAAGAAASAAWAARRPPGTWKAITSPAVDSAALRRNSRRAGFAGALTTAPPG